MTYEIKAGDTWPPLTLTLTETTDLNDPERYHPTDASGNVDTSTWVKRVTLDGLTPAPQFRIILKNTSNPTPVVILDANVENVVEVDGAGTTGAVEGEDPGLGVPANRGQVRGIWQAGDTDSPGDDADPYSGEVEVTWDTSSTPPRVERYPNDDEANYKIVISPSLD